MQGGGIQIVESVFLMLLKLSPCRDFCFFVVFNPYSENILFLDVLIRHKEHVFYYSISCI